MVKKINTKRRHYTRRTPNVRWRTPNVRRTLALVTKREEGKKEGKKKEMRTSAPRFEYLARTPHEALIICNLRIIVSEYSSLKNFTVQRTFVARGKRLNAALYAVLLSYSYKVYATASFTQRQQLTIRNLFFFSLAHYSRFVLRSREKAIVLFNLTLLKCNTVQLPRIHICAAEL